MTPPLFLLPAAVMAGAAPGSRLVVDGDEGRHAADVKRLRPGEAVRLGDGAGRIAEAVVAEVARGRVVTDVESVRDEPRPGTRFVVVQALARGGRDEAAVEAMTEVGVDEVIGWPAQRSVARWTDGTADRWRATARSATKQSRRAWLPVVTGPCPTAALADRIAAAAAAVVLDGEAERPLAGIEVPASGDVVVVVGPEGGITAAETAALEAAGAVPARLGPGVLRSSTAGVAALAVLATTSRWR